MTRFLRESLSLHAAPSGFLGRLSVELERCSVCSIAADAIKCDMALRAMGVRPRGLLAEQIL